MSDLKYSGINPDELSEYMTRALAIDQELNYRLECADMIEEVRLLQEQARCCFKTLAQVQNSLEVARYDLKKVHPVTFHLSDTVDDLVSMTRSKMRRSSIKITCDVEERVMCIADPDRFSACFVNLVVNALQNVDRDAGSVRVRLKKVSDFAAVSVIDNGYGMNHSELTEYMEREDDSRGFGILKKFCESVGTNPIFETLENGGFSVTIKVPLAPPSSKLEMNSDVPPPKMGTVSPCAVLLYKLDEATVTL